MLKCTLVVVALLAALGNAHGQGQASDPAFAYTWLVLEASENDEILTQAREFDRNFYQVFVDSLWIDGSFSYRLLLGRYDSREAAQRAEVGLPLPLRARARLIQMPRGALRSTLLTPAVAEDIGGPTPDAVGVRPSPRGETVLEADSGATSTALNLFIDCDICGKRTARREIKFVNHVRDRNEAHVHLLVTRQPAGFGVKYTLTFIGRQQFEGVTDTLYYFTAVGETDDERRKNLVRRYRAGLMRYLARTSDVPDISVSAVPLTSGGKQKLQSTAADDPWKLWSFQVGLDGAYEGEEATNNFWLSNYVSATRLSDDWKIQFSVSGSYSESNFKYEGETITSSRENADSDGQIIRSLGNHFAAGLFGSLSTSSFRNTDLSTTVASAFEYTLFPYSESSRRELRFSYYLNVRNFDYREISVFGKTSESLLHHEFQINLDMRQPWGSASTTFSASQYLSDFHQRLHDLYRLKLSGYIQLRIAKGLSLFATADASRIRDQIYLRRKAASAEDILLGRVQLPTTYKYDVTVGINFTFGSIYNNIVNPRFGT